MSDVKRIFVINTGSTSTKVALFENDKCVIKENLRESAELTSTRLTPVDQLPERTASVMEFIRRNNIDMHSVDAIAARGGMTASCNGGAYEVNKLMVDTLKYAPATNHASSLSPLIGDELSKRYNIPCMIYDSINTDEMDDIARISGLPEITNAQGSHVLNPRAVARKVAEKMGIEYEQGCFIVAHMGGGISVTAHKYGKIVDYADEYIGPMSPERSGMLPNIALVALCYDSGMTKAEMLKHISGKGGLLAYLGTSDVQEVVARIEAGDEYAQLVLDAMAYQIAKKIGEISVVFSGKVDAIILTGGIAHSDYVVNRVIDRVSFIAPVERMPGEIEMEALAGGILRVLEGREKAQVFNVLPTGYESIDAFYADLRDRGIES